MTAEIAVVNKAAVALAADSFMTVSSVTADGSSPEKSFVVNKLFTLSKHHPIGVMIYANAEFMTVPWESVIKTYRAQLGSASFATVRDYAEDFCNWLGTSKLVSSHHTQAEWLEALAKGYFEMLQDFIDKQVKKEFEKSGSLTVPEIQKVIEDSIDSQVSLLDQVQHRSARMVNVENVVTHRFDSEIRKIAADVFGILPLTEKMLQSLIAAISKIVARKGQIPGWSGIVIAGFGSEEIFPAVESYQVYGSVCDTLIADRDEGACTTSGEMGIIPFAQRDVADTFISGIDPRDLRVITNYIKQVFNGLPGVIADNVAGDDKDKDDLVNKLSTVGNTVVENLSRRFQAHLHIRHTQPLLNVLNTLPKEELAEIAESLVSLTSLKRKVSKGLETVGGPIDVAVISRGDGFVWIKRKHYFNLELNRTFLDRYFER